MVVNKRVMYCRIILQHLTYYFKNRLYLHPLVCSSYRTKAICTWKYAFLILIK